MRGDAVEFGGPRRRARACGAGIVEMSGQNFADRAAARRESQKGFTLIEMSIVLVIIGLIVGGILKGQEVVNNAHLKTQVAQIDAVKSAVFNFIDKFNYEPGDLNAQNAGLTTQGVWNGNQVGHVTDGTVNTTTLPDNAKVGTEMIYAWPQLALANLLQTVNTNPAGTLIGNGRVLVWPYQGKMTGSFLWYGDWTWNSGQANAVVGQMVRIDNVQNGLANTVGATGALKVVDAQSLDVRYDDGIPTTGNILVDTVSSNCANEFADANATYVGANTSLVCDLMWQVSD